MWKKNKTNGLYGNYTELDKNTPKQNKINKKDVLKDRYGFYNREVNNVVKNYNTENRTLNKENISKKIQNIKNNNTNAYKIEFNNKIKEIEDKISILNENIIILNKNLNIAKDKINQNTLLKTEDLLNLSHIAKNNIGINKSVSSNNNNIYDVIKNARNKNNDMKLQNINNEKFIEKNIIDKVNAKNNLSDSTYLKMKKNFEFSENSRSLNTYLEDASNKKNNS